MIRTNGRRQGGFRLFGLVNASALVSASVLFASWTTATPADASTTSASSVPTGLQEAIHRTLGPGPIGRGTAPLVSGIAASTSGWSALVAQEGISATITPSGSLHVSVGSSPRNGYFVARSIGIGTGGAATPVRVVSSSLVGGRLLQEMGPLATWYRVLTTGLEQGFTLAKAPAGVGSELVVGLGSASGWSVEDHGNSLVEHGHDGSPSLVYGGLRSTDASGTLLDSQLRIIRGTAQIVVHVSATTSYPVTIDPTWTSSTSPTAVLSNSGGVSNDVSGYSVSLSADGTTALVGAFGVGSGKGAAYIFHASGEGSWASTASPTATLSYSSGASHDDFGISVSLSADGTTAVVGAQGVNTNAGAAYVFHVASEAGWASTSTPSATLSYSGSSFYDHFGTSVTMSRDGTTALIGADGALSFAGAAYLYHVSGETAWASSTAPTAILRGPANIERNPA